MEIVEYLFGNFWHFLELLLLALAISGGSAINIKIGDKKEKDEE